MKDICPQNMTCTAAKGRSAGQPASIPLQICTSARPAGTELMRPVLILATALALSAMPPSRVERDAVNTAWAATGIAELRGGRMSQLSG